MLTSLNNPKVKEWKKLQKRKYRRKNGRFIVEGSHLVEEALNSDWDVEEIILREGSSLDLIEGVPATYVSHQVFQEIAETETPQGMAAIVNYKEFPYRQQDFSLLIDSVQDPGNLGTLIRTADAAGFSQVIIGEGSVDPFNEKVLRSTQGSLFHLPIIQGKLEQYVEAINSEGVPLYAAALEGAVPYKKFEPKGRAAIIVGNEGQGIRKELLDLVDDKVYIPIYGQAESLNVAIAAAILMYHFKG
ncbi:TrmH family RNA methyltransferase [Halobacillus campisalis]|uniref:TrmH family RNA methyltransferase n=1 Tax=Halobacillus campisalis TaxID=435909 RepID=A0ABW2K4L1_9BACI|nr:RNA methyltransferase [Halobacillus campisalis]